MQNTQVKMSKPTPTVFSALLIIVCLTSISLSAEFKVLDFEEDPMDMRGTIRPYNDMNADQCAVLRVESDVQGDLNLTDVQVYHRDTESAGVYYFYVSFRERHVTFTSEGYLPLTYKIPQQMSKGKVYILRIQSIGGNQGIFNENRAEIKLVYDPSSPEEAIYGGLDDMLMKINFSKGYAVFNPSPGIHKIKLNSEGRVWEKSYDIKPKEKVEDLISFLEGRSEEISVQDPGNLFITSDPSGAKVYLNKFEQGETPLTVDDVLPGTYQIEVVHDLYLPSAKVVEVTSNSYAKENFDLTPNFGRLEINSNPSDAMLWIHGQQVGKTPFIAERYSCGNYPIRLIREMYYEETDTISIEPAGEHLVNYDLKPQFGTIRISSNPEGASLSIDGNTFGETPVFIAELPSGRHIVNINAENYFDYESTIEIIDGQVFEETYELKPNFGLLTVSSFPKGAIVSIVEQNRDLGPTPLIDCKLPTGTYTIKVDHELFEIWERPIGVVIGDKQELEAELIRKVGRLRVKCDPPEAEVYLNDKLMGKTPNIFANIPTGKYDIKLEKKGYDIHLDKIAIKNDEELNYAHVLGTEGTKKWLRRRAEARGWSPIPGVGQFKSGQNVRGSIFVCSFVGGLAMTVASSMQYLSTESDYNDAMTAYRAATDQSSMDLHHTKAEELLLDMNDANEQVKIFSLLTFGIWALQFTDVWVNGGGERPVANEFGGNLKLEPFATAKRVGISVHF